MARGVSRFVPRRRRGIEHLDDPATTPAIRRRSHRDIQLSNALFGGTRALLAALAPLLPRLPSAATLLDIGTGGGDLPAAAIRFAATRGLALRAIGLDSAECLLREAAPRPMLRVCGCAMALPFPDRSIDVVCGSQLLHHFGDEDGATLLREMHRVARHHVIVSDLRRSWVAAAGLWGASFVLGFHPVSRHDGVTSVLRGFTAGELRAAIEGAVGCVPHVRERRGYRLTASWSRDRDTLHA